MRDLAAKVTAQAGYTRTEAGMICSALELLATYVDGCTA